MAAVQGRIKVIDYVQKSMTSASGQREVARYAPFPAHVHLDLASISILSGRGDCPVTRGLQKIKSVVGDVDNATKDRTASKSQSSTLALQWLKGFHTLLVHA